MERAEATRLDTRKFVLEWFDVGKGGNNYARAFHVIEVELDFLYDFFFTNLFFFTWKHLSYYSCSQTNFHSIPYRGLVLLRNAPTVKMYLTPKLKFAQEQ